jgi:hypothetical protein
MGSQQSHSQANDDEEDDNPQFVKNIQTSVPFTGPGPSQSQSTGPGPTTRMRTRTSTCTNYNTTTNTNTNNYPTQDSVVNSVIDQFAKRSNVGLEKYGTTLDRTDLTMLDWIQHAQEELMDGILYLEKIKKTMRETQKIRASPPMIR